MYQRILVPIDGSATSLQGLDEAIRLARLCGASLRLMYVIEELAHVSGFETASTFTGEVLPTLRRAGAELLAQAQSRAVAAGVAVDTQLVESLAGTLPDLVVEEARRWQADLIVIGSHGRRGVQRLLLGSDAEKILRVAPVPVLLVRSSEPPGT